MTAYDNTEGGNRRIAKNTMMLYVRLMLVMGVSLYTSRVVLNLLGVEDFGIYNVVGGAVAMFSFLSSSITIATQRFLSYELGRGAEGDVGKVFSMSLNIHCVIALPALILVEAVGLWLLDHKLNIPVDRIAAARIVFHCSVAVFIIKFVTLPYTSLIIAHERMGIYAWIGVIDVAVQLLAVWILQYSGCDRLIMYAVAMLTVCVAVRSTYIIYCRHIFAESRYRFVWEKRLFGDMFRHSNWMILGTTTNVLSTQGVNILMNTFFDVTVNAARGIAYQVYVAASAFVTNFMVAVQPQIIKQWAQGERESMNRLIFASSRFSFFLVFILVLPVVLEAEVIMRLWLKTPPDGAVLFTRLLVADLLFSSLFTPIATLSQASGRIGLYQGVIAFGFLSVFLITWLLYGSGAPAWSTFVVLISVSCVTLFARLRVLRRIVGFPVRGYCVNVLSRIFRVAVLAIPLPLILRFTRTSFYIAFTAVAVSSVVASLSIIWVVGMEATEKRVAVEKAAAMKEQIKRILSQRV